MSNNNEHEPLIVSLQDYRGSMQHPTLSTVEAYWEALRNGRLVPRRADVDPRGIDRALENAFILERIAPGMARFRLAGMHLNDLLGMEVRGMPLTSFFTPDARRQVSDALEHVFEEPATARFQLVAERSIGKPAMEAELILLPLKSDLGDVSRALGCLVSTGEIGRTPRRFDVAEVKVTPLLTEGENAPSSAETQPDQTEGTIAAQGFAEPAAQFRRHTPTPVESNDATPPVTKLEDHKNGPLKGERPYLRLVRDGD